MIVRIFGFDDAAEIITRYICRLFNFLGYKTGTANSSCFAIRCKYNIACSWIIELLFIKAFYIELVCNRTQLHNEIQSFHIFFYIELEATVGGSGKGNLA